MSPYEELLDGLRELRDRRLRKAIPPRIGGPNEGLRRIHRLNDELETLAKALPRPSVDRRMEARRAIGAFIQRMRAAATSGHLTALEAARLEARVHRLAARLAL